MIGSVLIGLALAGIAGMFLGEPILVVGMGIVSACSPTCSPASPRSCATELTAAHVAACGGAPGGPLTPVSDSARA